MDKKNIKGIVYDCIPFWMIHPQCRVSFYGAGNNIKRCFRQVISSGYCSLSSIIDKNYEQKEVNGIKAVSLTEALPCDCILITLLDESLAKEIKRELKKTNNSVQVFTLYEKITLDLDVFSSFLSFEKYVYYGFEEKKLYARKGAEYFPELYIYIRDYNKENSIREKLRVYLEKISSSEIRIIVLMLMYEEGCFDEHCMKLYVESLKLLPQKDNTLYGLTIDTIFMSFLHPEYEYASLFKDRMDLEEKICKNFGLTVKEQKNEDEKSGVAIIAMRYKSESCTDAPSKIVDRYATAFSKKGHKTKVFVLNSEVADEENIFLNRISNSPFCQVMEFARKGKLIYEVEECRIRDSRERMEHILNSILDFHPSFIVDMADESFVEGFALKGYYFILRFPLREYAYTSPADIFLVGDMDYARKAIKNCDAIEEHCLYKMQFAANVEIEDEYIYTREEFDLQEDDFIMVSVGDRLDREITEEMLEVFSDFMIKNDKCKWLIVGSDICPQKEKSKNLLETKKIILWGMEKHLPALYKLCDVYVNPVRQGGGLSIRQAMYQGMPIAMTSSKSDINQIMPKDIQTKDGYIGMVKFIEHLMRDNNYYRRVSTLMKKSLGRKSVSDDVEEMIGIYGKSLHN